MSFLLMETRGPPTKGSMFSPTGCPSVIQLVNESVCPCLSVCVDSVVWPSEVSVHMSVHLYVCLCLSLPMSVCLSLCPCVCVFLTLYICLRLSVCLSVMISPEWSGCMREDTEGIGEVSFALT